MMMEPSKQAELKKCFVKLEKLDMRITSAESDSDSSDLPEPKYLSPCKSKPKSIKTATELLVEQQSLLKNALIDTLSNNKMEEKIMLLQNYDLEEDEQQSSSPLLCEVKKAVLCVNDSLQFFNSRDITPLYCGYESSIGISAFEEEMLLFKRVELENVISSFLETSTSCCISDCKSFITYLLRNMSIREDRASIFACFNALNFLLTEHSDAKTLSFSSAEIFMLLFNYGIDIDTFKFLQQWPNVTEYLAAPELKTKTLSKIPSNWTFNLKMILKSVSKLVSICQFEDKDLYQIVIFLLWLSLDSRLLQENILPLVRENISACLKRITTDKWEETFCDIANMVIHLKFPNVKEKWQNIFRITEYVPVYLKRGIQLRRHISFLALKFMFSESSESDVDKNYSEFDPRELQNLMQKLFELDIDYLSLATKFMNIYITNLNASKEVYQEICNLLKKSECVLHHEAYEVKRHFSEMHTKLKILMGKDSVYKVSLLENISRKIKKEAVDVYSENEVSSLENTEREIKMDVEEDSSNNFIHIKSEPVDSEFISGEQNVYSTDDLAEDIQAATIYCTEDTKLKSAELDDDGKKGDICNNLNLSSNFNAVKNECNSNASDSEVPGREDFNKNYFIHSSMDVEEHANCEMKPLNTNTVFSDDNESLPNTKVFSDPDHCESSQSSASVCESVDEVVGNKDPVKDNLDTTPMLISESETKYVTVHEDLKNMSVLNSIDTSCNLPKQNIYDTEPSTMPELSVEHHEPRSNEIWIDDDEVVLVDKLPDGIEPETKLADLGDDDIEIVEVHGNVISFQEDLIVRETVERTMPSLRSEFSESTDFNCVKNDDLISDPNDFPSVNKSIISQCEGVLDEVLGSIDVAEEACVDCNSNQMLNNRTASIEEHLVNPLKSEQPLINTPYLPLSHNSSEQEDADQKNKSETKTKIETPEINDNLLNSVKCEGDCELFNTTTDKFIENGINEKSYVVDISDGEKSVDVHCNIFMAQDVHNYQPSEEYQTCKDNDLVTAIKVKINAKNTENLKRKSQISLDYTLLSKKHKTENLDLERINQVMDPVITKVLERVVVKASNSSLEKLQNKCQPNSEVSENNKEYSNSLHNIDSDLEICDEKEIKQNEDVTVIRIKHSKTTLKNKMKSQKRTKVFFKDYKRDRLFHKKNHKSAQMNKLKRKSLPSFSETETHCEKRTCSESSGGKLYNKSKSSKSGDSGLKHRNKKMRIDPRKSGNQFYKYMQNKQKNATYKKEKNATYKKEKNATYKKEKNTILSKSGLSIILTEYSEPNMLNDNLAASTSSSPADICISSDDSDSDVVELYTDPKRYADKDCLIVFESEDQIVIDSD